MVYIQSKHTLCTDGDPVSLYFPGAIQTYEQYSINTKQHRFF